MDVVAPLAVIFVLGMIILGACAQRAGDADSTWLRNVLFAAFILRVGAATMFATIPATRVFHDDAEGYERLGMAVASGWHGLSPRLHMMEEWPQNYGYYYFCAYLYYIGNACRVLPSYVNSLMGSVTVFLVYRLARQFFHQVVARRAALLVAFVPSMILWSSVALKDTAMTFCIVLSLSGCVALKRRFTFWTFVGMLLPVIAVQPLRFYMLYFLSFAIFLSLFIDRGARVLTAVPKQIAFLFIAVGVLALVGFSGRVSSGLEIFDLEKVSVFRKGMATTANSGFGQEADTSTAGGALAYLPKGAAYLLLSPFPWQFTSLRAGLAAPEMFVWWALIPSLIRGVRFAIKKRFAECSPLLLFSVTLTGAYSLVHGNVGSGFRQRAQIFVFLFIFAALGQYVKLCRNRGIDEEVLLTGLDGASPQSSG